MTTDDDCMKARALALQLIHEAETRPTRAATRRFLRTFFRPLSLLFLLIPLP